MSFFRKADPKIFAKKDRELRKTLVTRDFLALGVGTIISTSIFTLPGQVAAQYAGPAIVLSYLFAAIVAGLVGFSYVEMANVMPYSGSAYSWISVLFGEGLGWIAGWALLAEYSLVMAFIASGFSSNLRVFLSTFNLDLPQYLSSPLLAKGGFIDLISLIIIIIAALIVWQGASGAGTISQILVVLKIIAILIFIIVGLSVIHPSYYVPFVPQHSHTTVGGVYGIIAAVPTIFLAYNGFDSIASNSAEAVEPSYTMPRGILGSLAISVILFIGVTLVLVGMHPYSSYAGNSAPVSWALTQSGFPGLARLVSAIAVLGMLIGLIGMSLAGSRLIYAFGRDALLPKSFGKLNNKRLPSNALLAITVFVVLISIIFPFNFLVQLVSGGTLVAFMMVCLAMYALRKREGKDLPNPEYSMPFYPILPALGFLGSLWIFIRLDWRVLVVTAVWFILGLILYFIFSGLRKSPSES